MSNNRIEEGIKIRTSQKMRRKLKKLKSKLFRKVFGFSMKGNFLESLPPRNKFFKGYR